MSELQDKINEMIENNQSGLICEWDLDTWKKLEIPKEHRKVWNLVLHSHPGPIYLLKNRQFQMIPSVQMGDNVENDSWTSGTICKYCS